MQGIFPRTCSKQEERTLNRSPGPWRYAHTHFPRPPTPIHFITVLFIDITVQYAFGDFAISQVAKLMNKTDDATKYVGRAGNFVNVWNPNTTVGGSVKNDVLGMMQVCHSIPIFSSVTVDGR